MNVLADEEGLAEAAAERLAALAGRATSIVGSATICLTGGRTPERLYRVLANPARPWRGRVEWRRVHLFWGDERQVPPDHPDSNYGMAARALIDHVPVPAAQVHRIRGELPEAGDAAREYAAALREGFAAAGRSDQTFDLMLLGLGDDGHVASIFPGSALAAPAAVASPGPDAERVAAVWAPHLSAWRVTLTPRALLDARAIIVLVSGTRKAEAVHAALELPSDAARWPVHLLRAVDDRVEWLLDQAAAARLMRT